MFAKLNKFFLEVGAELKKVSWPTRQELWDSSWIVLISSFILGIFIACSDFTLSQMIKVIIK
jgi:preprotein translocase subunit SecE